MKRVMTVAAIVALVGAYLFGYWPQHQQVTLLTTDVTSLRGRVAELEARNRAAALLGDLLNVMDAVARKDYGQARQLSSAFFDRVREETTTSAVPSLRSGLTSVLAARDAVTSALTSADDHVMEQLRTIEIQLRTALGYPTAPAPAS